MHENTSDFTAGINANSCQLFTGAPCLTPIITKGRTFVRPLLVTRFIRLHLRRSEGRRDQLGGRCSSRVASKTSMPTLNEQRNQSDVLDPARLSLFKL